MWLLCVTEWLRPACLTNFSSACMQTTVCYCWPDDVDHSGEKMANQNMDLCRFKVARCACQCLKILSTFSTNFKTPKIMKPTARGCGGVGCALKCLLQVACHVNQNIVVLGPQICAQPSVLAGSGAVGKHVPLRREPRVGAIGLRQGWERGWRYRGWHAAWMTWRQRNGGGD